MSVQVRSSRLRSRPSFLGSTITEVSYGDRVTINEKRSPWIKVTIEGGGSGWLHESALSEDELELASGETRAATGASGEEIALAGKGFNDQVESEYQKKHGDLDYFWVDKMEKIVISPERAEEFLADGEVKPSEGGW